MKTRMVRRKGCIEVVYDDPNNQYGKKVSVAAMTLFEGTGCWVVTDWRLSQYKSLSPWSSGLNADDMCAVYRPESAEEREFVKSRLREYVEDGEDITWCTFDNIIRGHPDVKGYRPEFRDNHQSGYFGYKEALAKVTEIKAFWDAFEGDPKTARIENPDRQPSASFLHGEVYVAQMDGRLPPRIAA